MTESREVVPSDFSWSPDFVQELLPSAERTALLYHLSYLCLGGFSKLERLIRERAVETQMLFGSCGAVLLKCVGTSDNLVSSLFPMLMMAVEKNKPHLAVSYLEKAREWIDDIIRAVNDIVKRFELQNRSVATCTSDVIQEQSDTEKQRTRHSGEIMILEEAVNKLQEEMRKNAERVKEIKKLIEEKNSELRDHIKSVSTTSRGLGILAVLVPFVGPLIKTIYNSATAPGAAAKTQALSAELNRLTSEKSHLESKEWKIQLKLTDLQMQLATSKLQLGVIPSPDHLKDIQQSLSRIQQILLQLQKFWEKVGSLLDTLQKKTFINEDFIEELDDTDMKNDFLLSIKTAGESKDAYKFLEINPSSLKEDDRKKEYESVMMKLNQISPQYSSPAAITE